MSFQTVSFSKDKLKIMYTKGKYLNKKEEEIIKDIKGQGFDILTSVMLRTIVN